MLRAHAFIPEVAIDLIDAIQSADHQPLEIQLRRDAQKEIGVERIVMRLERPRRRAAGDRLHHRRLHFEIAARIEELANRLQHLRAFHEDFAALEIGKEIDIPLAVAQLDIGQPMILLRQRKHGLGQKGQRLDMDRQLSCPGAEEVAGNANVVAHVEQLVERISLLADSILANIDLQPLALLLERRKSRFALGADSHDASGDGDVDVRSRRFRRAVQDLRGSLAPLRAHGGDGVRSDVLIGVFSLPQFLDLAELFLS